MTPPVSLPPFDVLWHRAGLADARGPLRHPVRTEVVVVGAGIVGLTAALVLAEAGVDVTVVEGRRIGDGATGLSSAKVTVLHGTSYQRIVEVHGPDRAAQYAAANLDGFAWLEQLAKRSSGAPYWQDDVALTFALHHEERSTVEAEAEAAAAAGLPVDLVEHGGLPFAHHGAVALTGQGRIDPSRHLRALSDAFTARGGRIFEGTRVQAVERSAGGRRVVTDHSHLEAEQVLVTTGLPVLDRSLAFARTTCERSYIVAVRAEHAPEGMFLSAGDRPVSLRRAEDPATGEPVVLVGGEGHTTGREPDTVGCYERLFSWAAARLGARELVARWSTQDRTSADHLPLVGAVRPGDPSVQVATGFGKWGMTNGTVAGLVLAARAQGEESPWSEVFDASRLGPTRALPTTAKVNAEVAARLATGWVGSALAHEAPTAEGDGRVVRHGVHPQAEAVVGGSRHCLGAVCPHLGGIVSWNAAERSWDCPLHGSRFDHLGEVLDGPAVRPLPRIAAEPNEEAPSMEVTEITVDAPIQRVFDVLLEPRTYPRWLRGARKIRDVDAGWPEPGSAFHHQVGVAPLVLDDATTVRALEAPRRLELQAKARPAGVADVRFELEALAGGTTRVVLREAPESGPGRLVWSLGGRLWMRPMLRARNESSLQRLKDLVEAGR